MTDGALLNTYALAVQRMRSLQCGTPTEPVPDWVRAVEAAEREVDQLTTLHLLPSLDLVDFLPAIVEAK